MVEDGHYPELDKLMTRLTAQQKTYRQEFDKMRQKVNGTCLVM